MAQGYDGMQLDDLEVCKILKVMCSRLCFCFILSYVSSLDPEACSAACSLNLGCTRHTYLYVARFQTTESLTIQSIQNVMCAVNAPFHTYQANF